MPVRGGSIYVRVNGDLASRRPPIIMVHGGPGGALFHFFPALPLAADRAVILYDQLDSGRSDAPNDPANWTVERYVSEIDAVRSALGVRDFHLLGHSWGGILANRYAAARPVGLKSLVLQGAPLSDRRLKQSVTARYRELPGGLGRVLLRQDEEGVRASPEYRQASSAFQKRHFARTSIRSIAMPYVANIPLDRGDALAQHMMGNRIFGFGGILKGFDDEPLLRSIEAPTMVLLGEFDILTLAAARAVERKLRDGSVVELKDAGHMAQFDQPDAWRAAVGNFVAAHDAAASRS